MRCVFTVRLVWGALFVFKEEKIMKAKKFLSILLSILVLLNFMTLAINAYDEKSKTKKITDYSAGDIVEFGWYPQTEITDKDLINNLNSISASWVNYNYFSGTGTNDDGLMKENSSMYFKDVVYLGERYRAVKVYKLRPSYTGYEQIDTSKSSHTCNGYCTSGSFGKPDAYWFKYEPIRWIVLSPTEGLVVSEKVLDGQPFNNYLKRVGADTSLSKKYYGDKSCTYLANNYSKSSIREWLNDDFLNKAFSQEQKEVVVDTDLINSPNSENTIDKVFLLKEDDISNGEYGFINNLTRQVKPTDYAKCQRLIPKSSGEYTGYIDWIVRDGDEPLDGSGVTAVSERGTTTYYVGAANRLSGIRPAIKFNTSIEIFASDIATMEFANVGDIVYFGNYPQSAVNDAELIEKLNEINVPWISYEYYEGTGSLGAYSPDGMSSMKPSNFMFYKDVYYNDNKYRGVRIDKYRPTPTRYKALGSYESESILEQCAEQYNNGFELNTTYWYKYEPLAWEVLDPEEGLLLSTKIIDSQPYSNYQTKKDGLYYSDPNYENYLNSYYGSSIREWLNDDFATTAFSEGQISKLKEVELDNSDPTYDGIEYKPTVDKVYLLSYDDMTNPNYGFPTTVSGIYGSRMKYGTAYSKSQGLEYPYQTYSDWWLRTPCNKAMNSTITGRDFVVNDAGEIEYGWCSEFTFVGVVPAISVDTKLSLNCFYDQHEYGDFVLNNDATCSDGTKYRTCNLCGVKQTVNVSGSGSGHTYVSANNAIEPSCSVDGKESDIICSKCNFIYKQGEIIPALEHNRIIVEGYSATCTENGLTEGSKCSLCQLVFVKQKVISATGHTYTEQITKESTHKETGVKTFTCECGDNYTESIAKIPHSYAEVVTAPTCTERGYTTYTCECGDTYVADEVSAKGHNHISVVTTKPTHLKEGVETFTCACGDTYTKSISKLTDHTYTEQITKKPTHKETGVKTFTCECGDNYTESIAKIPHSYSKKITAPTCTAKGYTTYTCECGDSYVGDYVGTKSHTYTSTITRPATHLSEGVRTYTCSACGDSYPEVIAKTKEHSYFVLNLVEPTCETDGYAVYLCECGHTYNGDKKAATGHNYSGDTCVECGESKIDNCSCNCHKGGISGFFWKILRFFYKLFGTNKTCSCGVSHY